MDNIENSEILVDNLCFGKIQMALWSANAVLRRASKKYPPMPVHYTLHYWFPEGGREIPQPLLESIYIFRSKLKAVLPLPPKERYFLKILRISPEKDKIFIDGSIYPALLNSMREILFNQKDEVFYARIIDHYKRALSGNNADWNIRALNETKDKDISSAVIASFGQKEKFLAEILRDPDFDYVFNGVLQHTDKKYRNRFISDNENESLLFVLIKCAVLANQIRFSLDSETVIFDRIVEHNKTLLCNVGVEPTKI